MDLPFNRRSIRLAGYDYASEGVYFITLRTHEGACLFGDVAERVMCLNKLGSIALDVWMKTPSVRPNVELGPCVVMPNHMHGLLHIHARAGAKDRFETSPFRSPSQTVGAIVRGYKGAVIRTAKEQGIPADGLWQRNYYEHIVRTGESYNTIAAYIKENPKKWEKDRFYLP